jgi:hypothetical protein
VVRIDDSELVTFGKQIGLMYIEQDIQMSGTIRVIFQLSKVVNNVSQSDRTNTACANQLSGVVDDVRHWHSEDSSRVARCQASAIATGLVFFANPSALGGTRQDSRSQSHRCWLKSLSTSVQAICIDLSFAP